MFAMMGTEDLFWKSEETVKIVSAFVRCVIQISSVFVLRIVDDNSESFCFSWI